MIYTVTFNPSLDHTIWVDPLRLGEVNRTQKEELFPGGKGINVSIVLQNLGMESIILGFRAGFTGEALENMLHEYGCQSRLIPITGYTRINVKIKGQEETDINGQGPEIPVQAQKKLFSQLAHLQEGDVLVLAGSIPSSLPEDTYERICEQLQGRGISFVVDATGALLWKVLPYHPFLIKPNHIELGELFHKQIETTEEIVYYAKLLQNQGAKNVLVSRGEDGAVFIAEDGTIYQSPSPKGTLVNAVGAGDSMVAGCLYGYFQQKSYEQAFPE